MRQNIKEIELGDEGIQYVRQTLGQGRELSKLLLEILDLKSGELKAILPRGTAPDEVNQFLLGGKLPPTGKATTVELWGSRKFQAIEVPNMNNALVSHIAAYLKSSDIAFCIFENALFSAGAAWLKQTSVQTVTFGSSVYHFLCAGQTGADLIESTLKRAKSVSPPTVGILSRLPQGCILNPQLGRIELAELRKIAEQCEKLVVGAYDGESYLIWSKSSARRKAD
jgi:hypothetical protein